MVIYEVLVQIGILIVGIINLFLQAKKVTAGTLESTAITSLTTSKG